MGSDRSSTWQEQRGKGQNEAEDQDDDAHVHSRRVNKARSRSMVEANLYKPRYNLELHHSLSVLRGPASLYHEQAMCPRLDEGHAQRAKFTGVGRYESHAP